MVLKSLLGGCFLLSLLIAFVFAPSGHSEFRSIKLENRNPDDQSSSHLRLMTWNIGNADLEAETRAHDEDLEAVARVILDNEADAVALQELTGEDQLKLLLRHLEKRYRGYVCRPGKGDRVEAVLVKEQTHRNKKLGMRFNDVSAGDRFAAAASFRFQGGLPEIVLVSAHADAFNASRRRIFTEQVVDWARAQGGNELVFIAGDFNFEVSVRNRTNLFTDDAKHDSESFAYLLKYFRDFGSAAGETSINNRRIDYILGPRGTVSKHRAEVLRGAAVGRMDHWPLLVEVQF
jgi:endonuclease/exonuclease/phosphatase family metal-dependent hydrolase